MAKAKRKFTPSFVSTKPVEVQQPEAVKVKAYATGVATRAGRSYLAQRVETAMSQAVLDAYARGIRDPKQVRAMMLEARERVKAG